MAACQPALRPGDLGRSGRSTHSLTWSALEGGCQLQPLSVGVLSSPSGRHLRRLPILSLCLHSSVSGIVLDFKPGTGQVRETFHKGVSCPLRRLVVERLDCHLEPGKNA